MNGHHQVVGLVESFIEFCISSRLGGVGLRAMAIFEYPNNEKFTVRVYGMALIRQVDRPIYFRIDGGNQLDPDEARDEIIKRMIEGRQKTEDEDTPSWVDW